MNYAEAVTYLSDKRKILDVEVLEDVSRKWKNKKLVINTSETKIPFTMTKGSDLHLVIKSINNLIEYQASIFKTNFPKHLEQVLDFIQTCVKLESLTNAKNKFEVTEKFSSDLVKKLNEYCAPLVKLDYEITVGNSKGLGSIEEIIKDNTGQWRAPSHQMLENYPHVKRITTIKHDEIKTSSITFSKEDIKNLKLTLEAIDIQQVHKLITNLSKDVKVKLERIKKEVLDLDEELNKIQAKYKGKKFDNQISIIEGMVDNLILYFLNDETLNYFIPEIIKHFEGMVIFLAGVVKESLVLAERTDSWIFSKNV